MEKQLLKNKNKNQQQQKTRLIFKHDKQYANK